MPRKSTIRLRRAYEAPTKADGFRILVERLWPRGIAKADAKIDLWAKETAPSTELRKWYDHDPEKWPEFKRRYTRELNVNSALLQPVVCRMREGPVTFVFGSKETEKNSATVLKEFIEKLPPERLSAILDTRSGTSD